VIAWALKIDGSIIHRDITVAKLPDNDIELTLLNLSALGSLDRLDGLDGLDPLHGLG
jgi:hypothetical protein